MRRFTNDDFRIRRLPVWLDLNALGTQSIARRVPQTPTAPTRAIAGVISWATSVTTARGTSALNIALTSRKRLVLRFVGMGELRQGLPGLTENFVSQFRRLL